MIPLYQLNQLNCFQAEMNESVKADVAQKAAQRAAAHARMLITFGVVMLVSDNTYQSGERWLWTVQ